MQRYGRREFLWKASGALLLGPKLALEGPMLAKKSRLIYNHKTNPFKLNARLEGLATSFSSGTTMNKVKGLFETLHKGGMLGVKVTKGAGRPPRTAAETLDKGGDCTELATLVVALLKELKVPGGAMVVHFDNAPAKIDHMVPYAQIGNKKVIIDLQASELGATQQGQYQTLMTLTYDEAAAMYHREWGDYLRSRKERQEAIVAYTMALSIYEKDAYVHQNLSVLYEHFGDMETAAKHLRRAAELDPKRYRRQKKRANYNEELQRGDRALREERWEDCAEHFKNALESGEKIRPQEKKIIKSYIDHCNRKIK